MDTSYYNEYAQHISCKRCATTVEPNSVPRPPPGHKCSKLPGIVQYLIINVKKNGYKQKHRGRGGVSPGHVYICT